MLKNFLLFCLYFSVRAEIKPWEPEIGGGFSQARHKLLLQYTAQHKNDIKAIFIGASVTEYWNNEGRQIWDSYFAKHGAANYGIGGDTTSNVIWRLQNKEVDGLNPKVVVFSCGPGYNEMNAHPSATGEEVLRGLKEIITELRNKFPNSKLIIIGHTPYQPKRISDASVHNNLELKKLENNNNIFFFDLTPHLTQNGQIIISMFRADKLHLSASGYGVWDSVMRPTFEKLMNA